MHSRRAVTATVVVALAVATAVAAQNPPQGARRGPRGNRPAAAGQRNPEREQGEQRQGAQATRDEAWQGGPAQYLAEHPEALNLTPTQVARIRKVAARTDSANAPLLAERQQLTRGQQIRDMPPEERRRAAPQLRNVMQRHQNINDASLDSVEAILTPEQANRLETMREDFKVRREARRAAMQPRIDSARARAGAQTRVDSAVRTRPGRPPRP